MSNEKPIKFSLEYLETLRKKVPLDFVVSKFVELKWREGELWGYSPFVSSTKLEPDFCIDLDKNWYQCFSSGHRGDIFKFLMEIKNISFEEAVEEVNEMEVSGLEYGKWPNTPKEDFEDLFKDKKIPEWFLAVLKVKVPIEVIIARSIPLQHVKSEKGEAYKGFSYFQTKRMREKGEYDKDRTLYVYSNDPTQDPNFIDYRTGIKGDIFDWVQNTHQVDLLHAVTYIMRDQKIDFLKKEETETVDEYLKRIILNKYGK